MTAVFYLLLSIKVLQGFRFFNVKTDVLLKMFRAKNFRIVDNKIKCIIFDQ